MGKVYSFNKSVRGYSHIQRDISCEDASASYEAPNGAYHIIAVADGHGDPACFRSDRGSKFAVKAALDCLAAFAEEKLSLPASNRERFFHDIFSNERYRSINMRQLTDKVIDSWLEQIRQDLENDPPTQEQMADMYAILQARYSNPYINKDYIYGSTLMAGLWLPEALFLIHHGDGRCDVFYTDGSINQPIPWDPRCEGNMTTSLCQPDAKESFRHCVLNLAQQDVAACYLGSDGVEDAYRDTYSDLGGSHTLMGGVHTFYKRLSVEAVRRTKDEMEQYLEAMLPGFSENGLYSKSGSGDDVSVAGLILRPERLAFYVPQFIVDCKRYYLEENLFWKNHDIGSKTRKHGILQRRIASMEEEHKETEQDIASLRVQLETAKLDVQSQSEVVRQAEQLVQDSKRDETIVRNGFEDVRENQSFRDFITLLLKLAGTSFNAIKEKILSNRNKQEAYYQKQFRILDEKRQACQRIEDELQRCGEFLRDLAQRLEDTRREFKEYDNKYRILGLERNTIELKIQALSRGIPVTIPELEQDFSPKEPEKRRPAEVRDTEETSDTEAPKQEPSDTETPKQEASDTEAPEQELSSTEAPKQEPSDTETPEQNLSDTEAPEQESSDTEAPEQNLSDTETPKQEASDTEAPEQEASDTETPKQEASDTETPKQEASDTEAPEQEASDTETPKQEASSTEAPKQEPSDTETPKQEASDTEAPEQELSDTEAPKQEASDTEAPEQDLSNGDGNADEQ